MKALITLSVHVVCSEEEAQTIQKTGSLPDPDDVIMTKVVDKELIEDNIDAVKLVTDRYKEIGI